MPSASGSPAPSRSRLASLLIASELFFCVVAVLALSAWSIVTLAGRYGSHRELERFADARLAARMAVGAPDQTLWSPKRVMAWQASLGRESVPLAVIRIRRLKIEAPVLEGTNDWALNRGVGHIADTPLPGAKGNSGLAGHRDGFFRALKDIRAGETIEIETLHGVSTYRVERTWIVDPEDVSVLDPTTTNSLTLVTCYPFYFVGDAPQRFIVRAVDVSAN
jgi:sortase A